MTHKTKGLRRMVLATTLLLTTSATWADYNIWTGEYIVTHKELDSLITSEFPRNMRFQGLLQLNISHPSFVFQSEQNRLLTNVATTIQGPLLQAPVRGKLSLSSALKYDPVRKAIILDHPVLENSQIEGVTGQSAEALQDLGAQLTSQSLDQYPIYVFTPEQLQHNGQSYEPEAITIGKDQVRVKVRQVTPAASAR